LGQGYGVQGGGGVSALSWAGKRVGDGVWEEYWYNWWSNDSNICGGVFEGNLGLGIAGLGGESPVERWDRGIPRGSV